MHAVDCVTYEENTRKSFNDILCLFRALALHLHENGRLEEEISKMFTLLLQKLGGTIPASFQGLCMNDIPIVEDLVLVSVLLYDVDFVDGTVIGEFTRRSVGKHSNTVRLLQFNSHILYVSNINALFEAFRCLSCDQFIDEDGNLERKY